MQRFKTFEVSLKDIAELVDTWDRTIGASRPPPTPNHDGDDAHHAHPQSGKKGRKDHKHQKHDPAAAAAEKEQAKADKEVCVTVC